MPRQTFFPNPDNKPSGFSPATRFGNTVFTSATVLTVFMAGLAVGAYLAGRQVDRVQRPLHLYGLLEGLIGIYGLAMPLLLILADPGFFQLLPDRVHGTLQLLVLVQL